MDQNIYRKDSRAQVTSPVTGGRFTACAFTSGNEVNSVDIVMNGKTTKATYHISDTRMKVWLPHPLAAKTELLNLK